MYTNECGGGHCGRYATADEVAVCRVRQEDRHQFGPAWNGLCAFQDGRPVTAAQVEAGEVEMPCQATCQVPGGGPCTCSVQEYIRWNGLCAFQPRASARGGEI